MLNERIFLIGFPKTPCLASSQLREIKIIAIWELIFYIIIYARFVPGV
jgi:hypothetical protein